MNSLTFSRHSLVVTLACSALAFPARSMTSQKLRKMPEPNSLERFLLALSPALTPRASFARNSDSNHMSLNPNHYSNSGSLFSSSHASNSGHNSARSASQQQSQNIVARGLGCTRELENSIEDVHEKRRRLDQEIAKTEEAKAQSWKEYTMLLERLQALDDSIAAKTQQRDEYDTTLQETEAAYSHIIKSSQDLLHVLKRESVNLSSKKEEATSVGTFPDSRPASRPVQKKQVSSPQRKPGSYGGSDDLRAIFKEEKLPTSVDTSVAPSTRRQQKATNNNRKPGSYGSPEDIKQMFKNKVSEMS